MLRVLAPLVLVLLSPFARAACIANGHYAIVTPSLGGTAYPYTEDLAWRSEQRPIGDPVVVPFHEDGRWTKIQGGCEEFGERNVFASARVNLLLRASFSFSYATKGLAAAGTRYQVQLRLNDEVVLEETRRVDDRYPQAQRFGTAARNVRPGEYRYSMWFRLLDGPSTNQVMLGLLWLTAQGAPNFYPSATGTSTGGEVGSEWTPLGPELRLTTFTSVDAALVSSVDVSEDALGGDPRLELAYEIDGQRRLESLTAPRSVVTTFEHEPELGRGKHTVRLLARARDGNVRVSGVRTVAVTFPTRNRGIIPLQTASSDVPQVVSTAGDAKQPEIMSPICGRWTKVLEWTTDPAAADFSWEISGYVEFLEVVGSGYVQIGIEAIRNERDPDNPPEVEFGIVDMGMMEAQLRPGGDGIHFYGDCSAWGNGGGNRMALWIRILEGCNDAPFGGSVTVGRRRVAIKLLPSTNVHLP